MIHVNPRDLAFVARLGYVARRAGLRIAVEWRGENRPAEASPVYRLLEVKTGLPVTNWMDFDNLVERVRLVRDVNEGLEELG